MGESRPMGKAGAGELKIRTVPYFFYVVGIFFVRYKMKCIIPHIIKDAAADNIINHFVRKTVSPSGFKSLPVDIPQLK